MTTRGLRNLPKKQLTEIQKSRILKSVYKKGEENYMNNILKQMCYSCNKTTLKQIKNDYFIFFTNILNKFDRSSIKNKKSLNTNFLDYINRRIDFTLEN